MTAAFLRHQPACWAASSFKTEASNSTLDRSKYAAASLSSAAERGSGFEAPTLRLSPLSTKARTLMAFSSFGAALTTLADSVLSPSSFHHSGLATSAHTSVRNMQKALAVASAQSSEPTW